MAKEYFSHDYGTRHKLRLAALIKEKKMRGYGLFWVIVEMLYESSDKWMNLDEVAYVAIGGQAGEKPEYVKQFIHHGITRYQVFMQEGDRFTSERVLVNMDTRLAISETRRESGRKGGLAKWQNLANASSKPSKSLAKDGKLKESKVKENKVKQRQSAWDQYPTAETEILISDDDVRLAIEFVNRTKGKNPSADSVRNLFEAFRINLTGEFKPSRGAFMQHFRNWLKDRDFLETNKPQQVHAPQEQNEW